MAIGGIYLYDERFWDIFDSMEKEFGEKVTISDVNKKYIDLGCAQLKDLGQEVWIDCGTPDALQEGAVLAKLGVLNCEPCNIREGDAVAFFKD